MQNQDTFINELKKQLEARVQKNPAYSLRSFAKQLGISAATLSGALNGKRKLSPAIVGKIGLAMGLEPDQVWKHQKISIQLPDHSEKQHFLELSQDIFTVVADWYHLTILELMKLEDFQPSYRWVAKRLGINIHQAKLAVERLQRVGILEIKDGVWIDKMKGFTTHYQKDKTTAARKRYQKQLLEKSLDALQTVDYTQRDHSSTTMAIDVKNVMKAKEEIANFRKKLSLLLEKDTKPNEVYQLQISFFPLTQKGAK
jgi:uncharacterized protein (TIGR02147 family)